MAWRRFYIKINLENMGKKELHWLHCFLQVQPQDIRELLAETMQNMKNYHK